MGHEADEERVDGFGQRREVKVGRVSGGFGSRLAMFGVTFDEDGEHAETATEFDIGP